MGKIIVGYDDSEGAKKALEHALKILNPEEMDELVLVFIVPPIGTTEFEVEAQAQLESDITIARAEELIAAAISEAKSMFQDLQIDSETNSEEEQIQDDKEAKIQDLKITGIVKEGNIAEKLVEIGSDLEAKLIVLGYRGIQKIGGFSLGNVVQQVTRLANRPVLIVK